MEGDGEPASTAEISGSEPAFGSVQDAAETLTKDRLREERDALARPRAAPRELSDNEREIEDQTRNYFRKQAVDTAEDQRTKEGRPFNARTAAETLAKLRDYEGQLAEQQDQDRVAETPPQPVANEAIATEQSAVAEHPAVKAAIERVTGEAQRAQNAALMSLYTVARNVALQNFDDIKNDQDIVNLQINDPARHLRFLQAANVLHGAQQEIQATVQREKDESAHRFRTFADHEDARFREAHPELNDRTAYMRATESTMSALEEIGFSRQEIAHLWHSTPFMRDARVQTVMFDLGKYRAAMKVKPAPRPIPQVQRPGTVQARGEERTHYDALSQKFGPDLNVKQATALVLAKRQGRVTR